MTTQELRELIYNKYIRPTENKTETFIGVEIEMPIVNLQHKAVDFDVVHKLTAAFLSEFGFTPVGIDESGHIYCAVSNENGDVYSYDCSYNNAELSFGRESDLGKVDERFRKYYGFMNDFLSGYGHTLTGMGINPYRKLNVQEPIENGRYKMLFNHLMSYPKYALLPMHFHKYPNFGMFSSASQVQLDVKKEDIIKVINTFNKLEPVKAVLFSNSVLLGENEDLLCSRDMLWENSTHGINSHNVGMFDREFSSIEELVEYISSASIYCVERDGHYINFAPTSLYEYFNTESITGEYDDKGKKLSYEFTPQESDLEYLRTFKFEDLTFRGTIEFRSCCCQPINDAMTVAAFHIGLLERTDELKELIDSDTVLYHNGLSASELRGQLVHSDLPAFADEKDIYSLAEKVLDLCAEGLKERGYGEEKYLESLYRRAEKHTNPAKTMLTELRSGSSLETLIRKYA